MQKFMAPMLGRSPPRHGPEVQPDDPPDPLPVGRCVLYRKWLTWQMSDYQPLWIEIKTDDAEHYLRRLVGG